MNIAIRHTCSKSFVISKMPLAIRTSVTQPHSTSVMQQSIYRYFHMSELCPQKGKVTAWVPKASLIFQKGQMPINPFPSHGAAPLQSKQHSCESLNTNPSAYL